MSHYNIELDARTSRAIERNKARVERFHSGGYSNAIYSGVKDRALDGQAIKYNTPFSFPHKDLLVMFEPGCFGNLDRQTVSFCIDHELSNEIATTRNGLSLIDDDNSLQIRLDLEQSVNGYAVARLCELGNREAMSVHCDILESEIKTIAGHNVQVVSRARLKEVSLCKNGAAGDDAFAMLVDTTVTPKPVAGSRTKKFHAYNAMYKISRKLRELKASNIAVLALSEKIACLQDDTPIVLPMSFYESDFERIERMQSDRRAVLGISYK